MKKLKQFWLRFLDFVWPRHCDVPWPIGGDLEKPCPKCGFYFDEEAMKELSED